MKSIFSEIQRVKKGAKTSRNTYLIRGEPIKSVISDIRQG